MSVNQSVSLADALVKDEFGVHQMCNESETGAVSLHIYSPPIPACKIFDANSGSCKEVDSSRIDSRNRTPVVCIEPNLLTAAKQ